MRLLGSFFFIAFLLGLNDYLGIGFWTHRLDVYLILFVVIAASIGFASLLDNLRVSITTSIFACLLITGLTTSVFHDNQNIYKRYESPSTYSRIHPQELAAITWMNSNLSDTATIFTSGETRNYEWIPVLTHLNWKLITDATPGLQAQSAHAQNPITVFFTRKDNVPDTIINNPQQYQLIYENPSVKIYKIIPV